MTRNDALRGGLLIAGIVLVSLAAGQQDRGSGSKSPDEDKPRRAPERVDIPGIENAFRLTPRLYSGGDPRGERAFGALKALGVKTIISVDGAPPDVDAARKFGIRYVHLPVGYDGVPREQAVRLVRAMKTLPGPVFVHCHHGKHRGPTAAALCGISAEGWGREQALAWLKDAGTSPDYRGLFATVRGFAIPSAEELDRVGAELPERTKAPALVEAMVGIDKRWDHLKAIREAGYKAPAAHPDLDPSHEALQLAEGFRELLRLDASKAKGVEFVRTMEESERQATALRDALRGHETPESGSRKGVESAFVAVSKSCTGCHARYRDN